MLNHICCEIIGTSESKSAFFCFGYSGAEACYDVCIHKFVVSYSLLVVRMVLRITNNHQRATISFSMVFLLSILPEFSQAFFSHQSMKGMLRAPSPTNIVHSLLA